MNGEVYGAETLLGDVLVVLEARAEVSDILVDGIYMAVTGDVVATTAVAATLPAMLVWLTMVCAGVVNLGGCVDQHAGKNLVVHK